MKTTIIQTLFIIIVGLFVNAMHAGTTVIIKNNYRTPIILLMNDKEVKTIGKNENFALPVHAQTAQFKIKAEGSLISHSGIQREIDKALMKAGTCTITIPNTYGPRFEYNTSCSTILEEFKNNPTKTNFVRLINAIDKGLILSTPYKVAIKLIQASSSSDSLILVLLTQLQAAANNTSDIKQFEIKLKQKISNMVDYLNTLFPTGAVTFRKHQLQDISSNLSEASIKSFLQATYNAIEKDLEGTSWKQ